MRGRWAQACTQLLQSVPTFLLTKASHPTFLFDNNNVNSNNNTIKEENKGENNNINDNNDKETNQEVFYGNAI